jgi:DNA-binding HxlR family transcriptional regulator
MKGEPFCPVDSLIDIIGSRSTLLILRELFGGAKRTSDLLAGLGISSATLVERLRYLENSGIVHRITYHESPPRVEYQLTDKGWELQPIMIALRDVGANWREKSCYEAEKEHGATCLPCHLNKSRSFGNLQTSAAAATSHPLQIKRNNVFML